MFAYYAQIGVNHLIELFVYTSFGLNNIYHSQNMNKS